MTKYTTLTGNHNFSKADKYSRPRAYTDMHDIEVQNQMIENQIV